MAACFKKKSSVAAINITLGVPGRRADTVRPTEILEILGRIFIKNPAKDFCWWDLDGVWSYLPAVLERLM